MRYLLSVLPVCVLLFGLSSPQKKQAPTKEGYALLIAPNKIDIAQINERYRLSRSYGSMDFVHQDVETIKSLLESFGFKQNNISLLAEKEVRRNEVLNELKRLSELSKKNDIVFIYFTGHGDQLPERKRGNEVDSLDEVMVLTDDYFVDDDFEVALSKFNKGQQVVVVIDACHSGTTMKFIGDSELFDKKEYRLQRLRSLSTKNFFGNGLKSSQILNNCRLQNIQITNSNANLIYFGASADNEEAKANSSGSYLTNAINTVLRPFPPRPGLNYRSLFCEVYGRVQYSSDYSQRAHYYEVGKIDSMYLNYPLKIK